MPTTKDRLGSPISMARLFALVRALLPVGLGVFLWLTPSQPGALLQLSSGVRQGLAAVFILYGIVRLTRTVRTQFRKPISDDAD